MDYKRIALSLLVSAFALCPKDEFSPEIDRGSFTLPDLPYDYASLEPVLWSQIVYYHHNKHQSEYVQALNDIVHKNYLYKDFTVPELLSKFGSSDPKLAHYGGGYYNHGLLWWILQPTSCRVTSLDGKLQDKIKETWGSLDNFKQSFSSNSTAIFGSGWAWLCSDSKKNLRIKAKENEYSPLIDDECYPFFGMDLWEHSYYLYYIGDRDDYISQYWDIIDWELVTYFYEEYASRGKAVPV
jgi:Fe-Mn family superoxide dismutase